MRRGLRAKLFVSKYFVLMPDLLSIITVCGVGVGCSRDLTLGAAYSRE